MSDWVPIWLVIVDDEAGFVPRQFEGVHLPGENAWSVNMRGPGCRSKKIELVPEGFVHRTLEAAEARARALRESR